MHNFVDQGSKPIPEGGDNQGHGTGDSLARPQPEDSSSAPYNYAQYCVASPLVAVNAAF